MTGYGGEVAEVICCRVQAGSMSLYVRGAALTGRPSGR